MTKAVGAEEVTERVAAEDLPDLRALQHAKDHQTLEYNLRERVLDVDRPFVIFALLLDRALGDFIYRSLFAASVKLRFRHARLIVYYRSGRPYKEAVIRLNPYIFRSWRSAGSHMVPLDYFDYMGGRQIKAPTQNWYESLSAEPDLVLTPSMMNLEKLRGLHPIAKFAVPEDLVGPLHDRLLAAGLAEDRWFCVLHYREPGYWEAGVRENRDLPAGDAVDTIRYITETLGGQVVRIGHPDMTPIPTMPGFVDIGGAADPLMLHAYAVSRARFFIELSPSGPMALAGAFGVPMARCNAVSLLGPLDQPSFAVMQHIVGPGGERVPRAVAIAKGLYSEIAIKQVIGRYGYRFVRNSQPELRAAAEDIFERTADCVGWRIPGPPVVENFAEAFSLPLPPPPEIDIVEYPDAIPKFT
jgi:putative glycosyltransferase (TIGR04372 family)